MGMPMNSPSSGPLTRSSRSSSITGAHCPEMSICAAAGRAASAAATSATTIGTVFTLMWIRPLE